ncbi:unnamed protein product [Musa textilis]
MASIQVQSDLIQQIKEGQLRDPHLIYLRSEVEKELKPQFQVSKDGLLRFGERVCVPNEPDIKNQILNESHTSKYTLHPGSTKMYRDLQSHYWWKGMKKEIAMYVSKCLTCQQIKVEHQRPGGLLQPLVIPEWKWECITMDFVSGLPRTSRKHDAIWVIIDRLTKSAHFLPINMTYSLDKLADLYVNEIVRLHGIPKEIISDRDSRFLSRFWRRLQESMGTKVKFSTAYHPQTDGQSERTIQTLEDLLRAYVMDWKGEWDKDISLVEFTYNNSYHSSIQMAPYEALYGRKCVTPICWEEVGDRKLLAPDKVQETTEKIQVIRKRLKTAQSRQKSYADNRRRDIEFEIGDFVFLKVSPSKGIIRFGKKGKLSPRFIGPFEVLERVGSVAYRIALPPALCHVHDIFHVSMIRKYIYDPSHIIEYELVEIDKDLSYVEEPIQIDDRKEKVLRNRVIPLVQVIWRHHSGEETTWELEEEMKKEYPSLFIDRGTINLED